MGWSEKEEEWRKRALCLEVDSDLFFPKPGEADKVILAKKVCAACPVIKECLKYIFSQSIDTTGVWGGTSHKERMKMRKLKLVP